ncbi:MAG: hypothetical protein ABL308_07280 [Oceanicaulis sp.]
MKWLFAVLAVLVLVEAGAGFCQTAHAAGPTPHAQSHAVHDEAAPPCHGAGASQDESDDVRPAMNAAGHDCGGGAACLDCVLLTATLGDIPQAPAAPEPGLVRAFAPASAPDLVYGFDPPPPRG